MRYFVSHVCANGSLFTSFDKITDEEFAEFNELQQKRLFLDEFSSKHDYFKVELNDGWTIEEIADDNIICAIELIWKYLPNTGYIKRCLEHYY
jgi:hypothetical protein